MRWQPWAYIYTLFLIPFGFKTSITKKLGYTYFQLILIGVYLWSGIHKINMNFVDIIFPKLILETFGVYIMKYKVLGFGVPLTEILIAVGFFFRKTRKPTFIVATLMHLLIIFSVPARDDITNSVIIPWNMAMIVFCYFCFYKNGRAIHLGTLWGESAGKLKTTIAILSIVLPTLYFWGSWDHYLSYNLYSGKGKSFCLALKDESFQKLDDGFNNKACTTVPAMQDWNVLNVNYWAYSELNAPIPPQERIYYAIGQEFCQMGFPEGTVRFLKFERPVTTGEYSRYTCEDLKKLN